jgi:hypothetical protein
MSGARLPVAVDRSALRQALLHLVLAALAVVPEGGSLTLCVAAQGDQAAVEISPAAPGITADGGVTAGSGLEAARALLSPFGGTLVTVTDGPTSTPNRQRVQLPLAQGG